MIINEQQINSLVELAKLEASPEERKKLLGQINNILSYVSQLDEVQISDDTDKFQDPVKNTNIWREDEVRDVSDDQRGKILTAAPALENNLIKTKPVFKNE